MVECPHRHRFRPHWRYFWNSSYSSKGWLLDFMIFSVFIQFNDTVIETEGMAGSIMILACVVPLGFVWWQAKRLNPRADTVNV